MRRGAPVLITGLVIGLALTAVLAAVLAATAELARSVPPAELPAVMGAAQGTPVLAASITRAEVAPPAMVTVQRGDTLSGIASTHGVDWRALYHQNATVVGPDPGRIYPGQVLVLPQPGAGPDEATTQPGRYRMRPCSLPRRSRAPGWPGRLRSRRTARMRRASSPASRAATPRR